MPLDLNACNESCTGCVKKYVDKHDLQPGQTFDVKCWGIPKDYIHEDVLNNLPVGDRESALAMVDPVAWAAQTLDWHCIDPDGEIWKRKNPEEYWDWVENHPGEDIEGYSRYHRPYQAEMLRCTSKRKVFRIGRQSGKCLPSGTLIQMADGTQKPIELIDDGDQVVSITDDYRSTINPAFRACNGKKDVLKIELMDGREIEATYNHPFLSRKKVGRETTGDRKAIFHDEWIDSEKLTEDDYLAVPRNFKTNPATLGGSPWPSTTLIGCMLADGNITGNNCRFSNTNPTILSHLKEAVEYYCCTLKQYESDQSECDYHIVGQGVGKKHRIKEVFRDLGIQGLDSHRKYIPDFYMKMHNDDTAHMLSCMFGCDGWAYVDKNESVEIGYSTASERLASQMIALLARFGVYATVNHKTAKLNGRKFHSRQLIITRKESIANFRNKIGILGKSEAVETVYKASQAKNSSFKTEAYEDNDIAFIKIRSIRHVGKKMTWDLTVPETHNFIANNILTHNTETLVISMLFALFTKPGVPDEEGFKIVVITPYQSQIDLIFTRMLQLVRSSPVTSNSVKRNVKAPTYTLELYNGSAVRGFTAGTKSAGNAEAVRGQAANMLVFDEADYLSSGDIDAAMSIITNYPNATVWMSSTPQGRREKFYQTCNSKMFKEFHYPSQVNPLWNPDQEALFREQLTELGYQHEILAEFGEQEQGVFQNSYVQHAKHGYKYGELAPHHTWIYTFGVDWNDTKHGSTINILGFNPAANQFYIVDRHVVSRDGWTQMAACQKIAELNRIWKPVSIYLDAGFGGTQWEILRKYGFDSLADPQKGPLHPDSRLRNVVKRYDFGSKVETRDLFTKEIINKPAKPFLVESAVRRFEAGDIKFPKTDEDLEAQLLGYIIDRVTPTGNPVYKAGDEAAGDHALDELLLSIVAFVLEKTPFGKPSFETKIQFSGQFGEKTMPDVYPGDTVIHPKDPKAREKQKREKSRPDVGRSAMMEAEQQSLFQTPSSLPANVHGGSGGRPRVWSDPDFFNDTGDRKPRPVGRTVGEVKAGGNRFRRRAGRPRRKNI